MDLPELTEDGCNWQTYSSWVLKAISEDGLMGHLDGSETRPTTPKLLQEYDTPCEAFAYLECRYGPIPRPESIKVADEAMPQCDMQSEQYATEEGAQGTYNSDNEPIYSPEGEDSLDIPNDCAETKSRYLTPETEVIDMRQVEPHFMVVEVGAVDSEQPDECANILEAPDKKCQCVDDEGSQHASYEVEEGEDLLKPSSEAHEPQGDLPDTTSECAETQTGHRKPENEVVDMQQMVDVLPMFEVGTTGRTRHDKHVKEHEAPDEGGNPTRQAGKCSMEDVLQTPIEDYQHARTNGETITNVPDLPSTPTELPIPCIKHPTLQNRSLARKHSAMTTEFDLSYARRSGKWRETKRLMGVLSSARAGWGDSTMAGSTVTKLERRVVSTKTAEIQAYIPHLETCPKEPDKAEDTGGGGDDTASKDILNSCRVEKTLLANSGKMPPNGFIHPPRTLTDRYCHGRIKTDLQKLSTGREMERQQGGSPVPPAPPPNSTYYIHKSSKGLRHRARLKSNAENKLQQAKRSMAVQNQSTWESLPSKEDNGSGGHDDAPSSEYVDPHGVEKVLLTDSGSQHSEHNTKRAGDLPAPSAPSPNGILDMPTLFMDLRRHVRVKSNAENVSNAHTRQNTYRVQAAPKWLLPLLLTPSNRSLDPARGSWTMNVHYNELQQILSNLPRRLQKIANTYWWKGVPPGSMRNEEKWPRNLRMTKRLPRSSGTRLDDEYRAEQPNDSLAPPKRPPNGLIYTPSILRDSRRCATIKTRSKNVSTIETRGSKASRLTVSIPPPRELARPLWNVANTYWRHGIPPGQTQNVETLSLFDTMPQWQCCHNAQHSHGHNAAPRHPNTDSKL
ncbi:hypothetical protein F5141DRAFT_1242723 [Pisolithus sp. B1]|nr:hypothetical protein F5141DRAFT_1242723 [Pisolithus sp. B1]